MREVTWTDKFREKRETKRAKRSKLQIDFSLFSRHRLSINFYFSLLFTRAYILLCLSAQYFVRCRDTDAPFGRKESILIFLMMELCTFLLAIDAFVAFYLYLFYLKFHVPCYSKHAKVVPQFCLTIPTINRNCSNINYHTTGLS